MTFRSRLLALATGTALALAPHAFATSASAADAGLVVFDWAGYEDPEFFKAYTAKHGTEPTFAFFGDEEEAFQKLRAGFKADAAHPCSQSVPKWIEAGLLAPLDTSKITNWDNLIKDFRDIEAFKKDGKYYFVPMDWGNTAVTYRTDELKDEDVASLKAFADPQYKGRISVGDNVDDAYALAFLATGVKDWTNVTEAQLDAASAFLREVHKNVRTYWADGASLAQLMQSGEVKLAWAWNETYKTMTAEGHPVVMKRDTKEGMSSWVCGYVRLKDAKGPDDKFYDFINAWLEPDTSQYIVSEWGYGHSNADGMAKVDAEELKKAGLDDAAKFRDNTLWQSPMSADIREKMIAEFEKIKAGF